MPENDPSWAEYEQADDDVDPGELLDMLEEDTLVDQIGHGVTIPENLGAEHELAELLARIRDRHMQEPITTPPWEEHAEKPLPPRHTTTGGTVSFEDEAERLRNIASAQDFPTTLLRAANDAFDPIVAQVRSIVGNTSQHNETVQGAAEIAKDKIDEAIAATMNFEAAIHNAADGHARG